MHLVVAEEEQNRLHWVQHNRYSKGRPFHLQVSKTSLVAVDKEQHSFIWAGHNRYSKGGSVLQDYPLDQMLHSRGKKEVVVEVELGGGQEEVVGQVQTEVKGEEVKMQEKGEEGETFEEEEEEVEEVHKAEVEMAVKEEELKTQENGEEGEMLEEEGEGKEEVHKAEGEVEVLQRLHMHSRACLLDINLTFQLVPCQFPICSKLLQLNPSFCHTTYRVGCRVYSMHLSDMEECLPYSPLLSSCQFSHNSQVPNSKGFSLALLLPFTWVLSRTGSWQLVFRPLTWLPHQVDSLYSLAL